MTHIVNLLYGDDRRNPDRELNLNSLSGGITLADDNAAVPGASNLLESGQSIRFDGQRVVNKSRDNMRINWKFVFSASNAGEFSALMRQVLQFAGEARANATYHTSEAVWLECRWNSRSDLDNLPRPAWGQLNYYARVLDIEAKWPSTIFRDAVAGVSEDVELTFVCEPYWYGLEQVAINTQGAMDVTDQYNTTLSAGLDFSGQFAIAGWFEQTDGLAAVNQAFRYYVDSSNMFEVYQWTANAVALRYTVGGVQTLKSVASNAAAPNHFVIVQGASSVDFYVNGVAVSGSLSSNAWSTAGTLFMGCRDAAGTVTETTTTLDGWRFWETTLTAAQVAALYAEELAIKNAGQWVGKPPYQYTYNATGRIYRGNSTTSGGYNCAIVGNVNGDVPALGRYRFAVNATSNNNAIWLGRYASPTDYSISGVGMVNIDMPSGSPTSNTSSHSNDYEATTLPNLGVYSIAMYGNGEVRKGRYKILARISYNNSTSRGRFFWYPCSANQKIYGDYVTLNNDNFNLFDLGDFVLDYYTSPNLMMGAELSQTNATSTNVYLDFIQLLPYPCVKLTRTVATGTAYTAYLEKSDAYLYAVGGSNAYEIMDVIGSAGGVTLEPGKYNNLMLQIGLDANANTSIDDDINVNGDYLTLTTYITPRYTVPGGLIA